MSDDAVERLLIDAASAYLAMISASIATDLLRLLVDLVLG